jgi:hypothetical protein
MILKISKANMSENVLNLRFLLNAFNNQASDYGHEELQKMSEIFTVGRKEMS